jgi:hypothetical protein
MRNGNTCWRFGVVFICLLARFLSSPHKFSLPAGKDRKESVPEKYVHEQQYVPQELHETRVGGEERERGAKPNHEELNGPFGLRE